MGSCDPPIIEYQRSCSEELAGMLTQLEKLDARIPRWNVDALTKRDCPFCGSENEPLLVRPDSLPVAFCGDCGCWYVARLPSRSEIKRLYGGYYFAHRPADLSENRARRMRDNALAASDTDWQFQSLSKLLGGIAGKRILDVGCGCGEFLLMARARGANVIGCDLSPEACAFVQNRLGITTHQSDIESCVSSIGNVDAVVMRDFIEHPVEPLTDIRTAWAVLSRGGLLLWLTPNGGEAGTDVETAKDWVGFRVDLEHLQYVSPCTVNYLARELSMRIERLVACGFPGIEGIDKLPKMPSWASRIADSAKSTVKRIPHARRIAGTLRAIKAEVSGEYRDPCSGSYHLFAVLRKI